METRRTRPDRIVHAGGDAAAFGLFVVPEPAHTKARSPIRSSSRAGVGLRNGAASISTASGSRGDLGEVDNPRRCRTRHGRKRRPDPKSTLVGLEFQGLTGVAAISLKGGEEARLRFRS